ncbi:MAG: hypothetical protein M3Y17_04670 [Actinomycetota bacterium]|nr:hypothetical protein [Actinomycetota bacterium]
MALYEPEARLALPGGDVAAGTEAIRRAYEQLLADRPTFTARRSAACAGERRLGPDVDAHTGRSHSGAVVGDDLLEQSQRGLDERLGAGCGLGVARDSVDAPLA